MSDPVVTADTFSPAIERILGDFLKDVDGEVLSAVKDAGRDGAEAARAMSPRDTGAYASGWTWEVEGVGGTGRYIRIYNRAKPSLTHLLENGHAEYDFHGRKTGGTVKGRLHIAPAADVAMAAFEREVGR